MPPGRRSPPAWPASCRRRGGPRVTTPSATSRGPTSRRTGTPFSSQSTERRPKLRSTRSSSSTRTPQALELGGQLRGDRAGVAVGLDEHHDDLGRGEAGRHPQAGVVAVAHDQAADHPRRHAPRRRPAQLLLPAGVQVLDLEGPGEVLAQLVAGAHLQGLAVAHHRLAGEGVDGAGEALPAGLAALEHGDREHLDHEVAVDLVQDLLRVGRRVLVRGVGGVALLPEELAGAQEQAGAQLPADDVVPRVPAAAAGPGRTGSTWPCTRR